MVLEIFMELKLHCIGCPMDGFHTLKDVAKENNLDLDYLLGKIQDTHMKNGITMKTKWKEDYE